MRIAVSTFVLQGGQSGVATYVRELLRALQTEDAENRYDLLTARSEAHLVPVENPNFAQVLLPDLLNHPLASLAWHNLRLPQARYDLLHIPSARRIPLRKRTRIVATVHDLAAFALDAKYDRARMLFNRRLVPAMIRRADHVIAVSHATKNDLVRFAKYPEERISVVYSGIDHGLFRPGPKPEARDRLRVLYGLEKPFLVYVSRLEHPAKNHVRLIEAFELFKLANDSAHQLVLAGADWRGADVVRARAAQSPVRDEIVFLGFVPCTSLPLLYNGCDMAVHPSLFEGFGFPIVEALACGAPTACSNTSSMKEIAGDWLPTFDPASAEAMCRSIESLLGRGGDNALRARGMEYAHSFDWGRTARKTLEIYRAVA